MQTKNANIHTRRPGLATCVALLAFAVFQLDLALHQSEHTITDIGETCVACSYFNDVGPTSEPAAPQVAASLPETVFPAAPVVADNTCRYPIRARAPPFA